MQEKENLFFFFFFFFDDKRTPVQVYLASPLAISLLGQPILKQKQQRFITLKISALFAKFLKDDVELLNRKNRETGATCALESCMGGEGGWDLPR
jgi:hypothetical protein